MSGSGDGMDNPTTTITSPRGLAGREHTAVRFAQLSIRHLQALDSRTTSINHYDAYWLFACPCAWLNDDCPPLKELALYSWSLVRTEIGECPFATGHIATSSLSLASRQLSTRFVSIDKDIPVLWDWLIRYLQVCVSYASISNLA